RRPRGAVWIVGDDHVARIERPHRLERARVVDPGHARHAQLARIGEEVAARGEETAGEVGGLLDERGVRGTLHRVGNVLHRAVEIVPEELEGQGIETHHASRWMRRLPKRSTSAASPAGTSTVVCGCSTIAGPTTRSPRPRVARSYTRAWAGRPSSQTRRAPIGEAPAPAATSASGTRGRTPRSCTRRFTTSTGACGSAWPNARSWAR